MKRGLNVYPYCGSDPVNHADPTGEIANVLISGIEGGLIGLAAGFAGSAGSLLEQAISGERMNAGRGICALQDIFGGGLGIRKAYGYRYEMRDPDQPVRDGFDLGDFLRSTLTGGLMGGLSGVAFYGMGKAVEVLKGSLSRGNKNAIPGTSKLIGVGEGEKFGIYAAKATPVEGYTDVIVHGAPPDQVGVMHNGEWRLLDHRSLAKFLNQDGGYTGGAIRLLSCGTGSTADGFAQNLSNKMGVKVMAPSDTIWAFPSGRLTIGPNQFNNSGQWNIFIPRKL